MTPEQIEALANAAVEVGLEHLPPEVPSALRPAVELALQAAIGVLVAALRPHALKLSQAPGSTATLRLE